MSDPRPRLPADHPAMEPGTSLHDFLQELRAGAAHAGGTDEDLLRAGTRTAAEQAEDRGSTRPFLSVVTRTQGARLHCLTEVLTCLAGQTSTDFEVLVVGHRLDDQATDAVQQVIDEAPRWLRDQVRLLHVDRGERAAPLNEGFAAAKGWYIAILDDDDLPFAHWVQTFGELAQEAPGRVLRTVALRQDFVECTVLDERAPRAAGPLEDPYPAEFDFVDHLRQNFTPNTAIAFPRGAFHHLGIRFDETLTTTEDWDFIMRTVAVCGVASRPEITCLYRWWVHGASSSRTHHSPDEWVHNFEEIVRRMDERPVLFPPGSTRRIRTLLRERDEFRQGVVSDDRYQALLRILTILESRSWKVAAPIRFAGRLLGGRPVRASDYALLSLPRLLAVIEDLESSRSWRWTRFLRR